MFPMRNNLSKHVVSTDVYGAFLDKLDNCDFTKYFKVCEIVTMCLVYTV